MLLTPLGAVAGRRLLASAPFASPAGFLRALSVSAGDSRTTQARVEALRAAMAEALESAETVTSSAEQLLLETDPAARGPREAYEQHYAELAVIQLHSALDMHAELRGALGQAAADELLRQERLAVAECQLWRDRMHQLIANAQRRLAANEVTCQD